MMLRKQPMRCRLVNPKLASRDGMRLGMMMFATINGGHLVSKRIVLMQHGQRSSKGGAVSGLHAGDK
jgi:hypothetical protein